MGKPHHTESIEMSSIFTRIIHGDIPCHKIWEDDRFFAFLDIHPIRAGHTLLIPKVEVDRFFDMDADMLTGIMLAAKPIAAALEKVVPCNRVGMIVAGLEVPHAHMHLIPIDTMADLDFGRAKGASPETLADMAAKIRAAL
jgi:histidine triad (HIT) family protein